MWIYKKSEMAGIKKITVSAVVIAAYVVVMFLTQSFAFGQYQIRIATGLYALAAIYPFLILPLGLANFLSNTLMGGLGLPDMIGGFCVASPRPLRTSERCRLGDSHKL